MNKSLLIFPIISILFSCGPKIESSFKKIKVNNNVITLVNQFYKCNNVIYGDVSELSKYLGSVSINFSPNYDFAMIGFSNGTIASVTKDKKTASKGNISTQETKEYTFTSQVRGKNNGLDIPVDDYVSMLDFTHTIESDIYVINKITN